MKTEKNVWKTKKKRKSETGKSKEEKDKTELPKHKCSSRRLVITSNFVQGRTWFDSSQPHIFSRFKIGKKEGKDGPAQLTIHRIQQMNDF